MCCVCDEVHVEWGQLKEFLFAVLIEWWWQGKVVVQRAEDANSL
jgi:hypothetical protein